MFPEIEFITEQEALAIAEERKLGKTFLIDFDKQKMLKLDGKLIKTDDERSIRMWIEKKILTEKNKYKIYNKYGMEYREMLLGKRFPTLFLYAELEREVKEEMLKHPRIYQIENFEAIMERSRLKITFKVILDNFKTFEWEKYLT